MAIMASSSSLQFSNSFSSSIIPISKQLQQSKPLLSFSRRALEPENNTSSETTETPPPPSPPEPETSSDPDSFENRLAQVRLRYKSGTGKKAELRKGKKSKKGSSSGGGGGGGGGVFLPPVPLKEPVSAGMKVEFGFSRYTERLNGRLAGLGLAALLLVELASASTFWAVGLAGGFSSFLNYFGVSLASFWAGNSFVTFLSGVLSHVMLGYTVVISLLAYFIIFSQILINGDRIPLYWIWFNGSITCR